jgi:hypothetical protein
MLTLDALEWPPTIYCVLTAREFLRKDDDVRRTLGQVVKAVRRRWPEFEYHATWEEQKRGALHVNLAVKGVPPEYVDEFRQVIVERWCSRVDARPKGQYVEEIANGKALTLYMQKRVSDALARTRHGLKASQQVRGWRNKHRTSQTLGYLVRPAKVMREEARASLAAKRRLWRAIGKAEQIEHGTPSSALVELVYEQLEAQELAEQDHWELVRLLELGTDVDRQLRESARAPFKLRSPRPGTRPVAEVRGQLSG